MQDFTTYNYDITISQLEQAQKIVDNITIIINGEYYTLIEEPKKQPILTHHIPRR